jgi:hypothetical protein
VKTPLGLFTLVILVTEAIVLAESAIIGAEQLWMPFLIIAIVIVLVFVLAIIKPDAVGLKQKILQAERYVTMMFPKSAIVDFDDDSGELWVKPRRGKKTKIIFTPTNNEEGGWYHTLPDFVKLTDQIRICVIDTTGQKWRTKTFVPRSIPQTLSQVSSPVPTPGGARI